MERYPDLKANQNVLALQEELVTTENRVGFARQLYNDLVARYNTRQQVFPTNLVAGALGFRPAEFFQADAVDRALPRVDLGPR
jgi:LemA protein